LKIGNVPATPGAAKSRKRIGRGPGSGHGKTSTRGHKGQKARAGGKSKVWSEGGQMPLQRRLPKRGFTNIFKKEFQIVNLSDLSRAWSRLSVTGEGVITPQIMREKGLIKKADLPVKILGDGEFAQAVTIQASAFSQKAKEKIQAAGGKIMVIK
jgi:large subunit ribosomal protein L15